MRYRLGSFSAHPGSSDFESLLAHPAFGEPLTQALEEMLRVRLARATPGPCRDLLDSLDPWHPDRAWVEAVHDGLRRVHPGEPELRLLACDYEPGPHGFLTIAAAAPGEQVEVSHGDWMLPGFAAMREGSGPVCAWPRLLREVCSNGSLVCTDEFEKHEGADGIGEAVVRFLSALSYEPVLQALREAQVIRVADPHELMDEYQRMLERFDDAAKTKVRHALRAHYEQVLARFEDDGDDSLYGLFNAITATARDLDDWRERLALEESAGQLALLRRPVPRRSGGAALVPA